MKYSDLNKMGYVVGVISVIFYLVCTVWGGIFSSSVLRDLHLNLLQLTYPGFAFTTVGYIVGLVEAFVYGWIIGILFAWLHRKVCLEGQTK